MGTSIKKVSVPVIWDSNGNFQGGAFFSVSVNSIVNGIVSKPTAPQIPGFPTTISYVDTLEVKDPTLGSLYLDMTLEEYNDAVGATNGGGGISIGEAVGGGSPNKYLITDEDTKLAETDAPTLGIAIGDPIIGAAGGRVLYEKGDGTLADGEDNGSEMDFSGGQFNIYTPLGGGYNITNEDGTNLGFNIQASGDRPGYIYWDPPGSDVCLILFPRGISGTITVPTGTGTLLLSNLLGVASGIATLDSGGLVPLVQLPITGALTYKGAWNATTNSPTLIDGTGTSGDFYVVSVGGTRNLGSGSIVFVAGNGVLYNGTIWQQIGSVMTGTVTSVNSADGNATVANPSGAAVFTIVAAPKLATPRNINNVPFDGSADILLGSVINAQTGTTYTLLAADNQKWITANNTSAQAYTIPTGLAANFETVLSSINTGIVSIVAAPGVTLISYLNAVSLAGKGVTISIKHLGSNVFILNGNLV